MDTAGVAASTCRRLDRGSLAELVHSPARPAALSDAAAGVLHAWSIPEHDIYASFVVGNCIILLMLAALLLVKLCFGSQGRSWALRRLSHSGAQYVQGQPAAPVKSALRHLAADEGEALAVGKGRGGAPAGKDKKGQGKVAPGKGSGAAPDRKSGASDRGGGGGVAERRGARK